ncbi:MAG: hypothetical protein Q7S14_01835 [bacterium]|nr:hypothetical protein [bacterium]
MRWKERTDRLQELLALDIEKTNKLLNKLIRGQIHWSSCAGYAEMGRVFGHAGTIEEWDGKKWKRVEDDVPKSVAQDRGIEIMLQGGMCKSCSKERDKKRKKL